MEELHAEINGLLMLVESDAANRHGYSTVMHEVARRLRLMRDLVLHEKITQKPARLGAVSVPRALKEEM